MTQNYYIFYFETADDNEFEILRNFLEGQQLACNLAAESTAQQQREAFRISKLPRAAGSAVAELLISAQFGKKLRELHSYEPEAAPLADDGKVTDNQENDLSTVRLAGWLNEKLKQLGCNGHVKIGEETAG